jgi:hypothetical protein
MDILCGDGSVERTDCPKQRIIPHDMVHYVVESTLAKRGFIARVRDGERADMRMRGEAESDGVERLMEVIQGDALDCPMLDVTVDDHDAVRAQMAELTKRWDALPVWQSLALSM